LREKDSKIAELESKCHQNEEADKNHAEIIESKEILAV